MLAGDAVLLELWVVGAGREAHCNPGRRPEGTHHGRHGAGELLAVPDPVVQQEVLDGLLVVARRPVEAVGEVGPTQVVLDGEGPVVAGRRPRRDPLSLGRDGGREVGGEDGLVAHVGRVVGRRRPQLLWRGRGHLRLDQVAEVGGCLPVGRQREALRIDPHAGGVDRARDVGGRQPELAQALDQVGLLDGGRRRALGEAGEGALNLAVAARGTPDAAVEVVEGQHPPVGRAVGADREHGHRRVDGEAVLDVDQRADGHPVSRPGAVLVLDQG